MSASDRVPSSVRRRSRYSTTGQRNGTDGFTFLIVLQPQATRLGVGLCPFQVDHFASPAAGQRKLADDVDHRRVFLLLGGVAERPT